MLKEIVDHIISFCPCRRIMKARAAKKKQQQKPEVVTYDDITKETIEDFDDYEQKTRDRRTWTMSAVEYARYKKFLEDHDDCMVNENGTHRFGTIGGGIVVSFMGTGLGNIVHVKCEACGKEADLTDTTCW